MTHRKKKVNIWSQIARAGWGDEPTEIEEITLLERGRKPVKTGMLGTGKVVVGEFRELPEKE